ncbi:MAG: ATP-binding protein [Syntrophaceae bacterium]|nr:ATP-binding protein [Syntrophaceae bacterium]
MHPRVFSALGADLVTNDVVAVIELVKNAYDAFATRVDVRFGEDSEKRWYLEIKDNGYGMELEIIKNVWCVVATPFRVENPISKKGKRIRRVAGEKGLGRLSAARLGNKLEMLTKTEKESCWRVLVDWSDLSAGDNIDSCYVSVEPLIEGIPFENTGTSVRIYDLKTEWDEEKVADLKDNLSRLVSPFASLDDFRIFLTLPGEEDKSVKAEISSPEFLTKPKYAIRGRVSDEGTVHAKYVYSPIRKGSPRSTSVALTWAQIVKAYDELEKMKSRKPGSGPFEFEIRAWDIGAEDTEEIADSYHESKTHIRKAIRSHKGISVYRDGILVLPKSEDARDWLGLDLRRVSRVGTRLSTSQIVGYVAVSADTNPEIRDASDREGLMDNNSVRAFQGMLKAIVGQLENEREKDRLKPTDEEKLSSLFEELTADDLLAEMVAIAEEGAPAADAIPILNDFNKKLEVVRNAIKKRFTYYSRLATVGTIAQMLVHEIRNRTTVFGSFIRYVNSLKQEIKNKSVQTKIEQATNAVDSLEQLADTFAPLASRSFRRGHRDSIAEKSIQRCLTFIVKEIKELDVEVHIPDSETRVGVDPGELDAIILNLLTNSMYWLRQTNRKRKLEFCVSPFSRHQRLKISIHDSGPGVNKDDADKIFLPGVTKKPGGIGMGLTVASELVAEYGGEIYLTQPGELGGASFTFDVPIKQ